MLDAKKTPQIGVGQRIAGVTPHALAARAALLADLPRQAADPAGS